MITQEVIVKQLSEVVVAIRQAKANGIACLLPDVVIFEDEGVYFEVPLQDEVDVALSLMEREAAKVNYSIPFKGN